MKLAILTILSLAASALARGSDDNSSPTTTAAAFLTLTPTAIPSSGPSPARDHTDDQIQHSKDPTHTYTCSTGSPSHHSDSKAYDTSSYTGPLFDPSNALTYGATPTTTSSLTSAAPFSSLSSSVPATATNATITTSTPSASTSAATSSAVSSAVQAGAAAATTVYSQALVVVAGSLIAALITV